MQKFRVFLTFPVTTCELKIPSLVTTPPKFSITYIKKINDQKIHIHIEEKNNYKNYSLETSKNFGGEKVGIHPNKNERMNNVSKLPYVDNKMFNAEYNIAS